MGGEQAIHTALRERLHAQVRGALMRTYHTPVRQKTPAQSSQPTAALRLPYGVTLCGEFATLSHFMSVSGGTSRCPNWWPCAPTAVFSLAARSDAAGTVRDQSTISIQWALAVWILVRWCAIAKGSWNLSYDGLVWPWAACGMPMTATSLSRTNLYCTTQKCARYRVPAVPFLPLIAVNPLPDFFTKTRRSMGGPRGEPFLRDISFFMHAPVLNCTGKISEALVFFAFALMSIPTRDVARQSIYNVMGRSNLRRMYLRELGRLVAPVVCVRTVLVVRVDGAVTVMLQSSQLLTAAWRRATSTATIAEREGAEATLQFDAALLRPLYACIKPLDPETKRSGFFNLDLHTAIAHIRHTVGKTFHTAKNIRDDHIEGKIAEMNRYFKIRTNNVSREESLINKEAEQPLQFTTAPKRTAFEMMIYTEQIEVCPCVLNLGTTVRHDLGAAIRFAEGHPDLLVDTGTPLDQRAEAFFLPAVIKDEPKEAEQHIQPSTEMRLHNALHRRQRCIAVCTCVNLSGNEFSA